MSSILNSDIDIELNTRIIRVFTKLREYALTYKEILVQLAKLEKEVKGTARILKTLPISKILFEKNNADP